MSFIESKDLRNLSRYVRGYLGGLRSLHMDIEGEEFKYLEGGEGETLIFLHGILGSKTQWRSLMQAYTSHYRVVAVDIPGLCLHQTFAQKKHTLRQLSIWLDRVVDRLRCERVHLVCHSMGCALGTYFAATRPERVDSIALMSFPNLFSNRGELLMSKVEEVSDMLNGTDVEPLADYYRRAFAKPPSIPKIVLRYNLREVCKYRESMLQAMREFSESSPLLLAQIRHLKAPCLIIQGDQDGMSPVFDDEFWRVNVPHHESMKLTECGHMVLLEKPDEIIFEHRRFLERVSKAQQSTPAEDTGRYGIILD
ncbi:alpha/beta fold hydrolase [Ketobacter sp.]|uniref:alpha/beta fold hydrolase n=1 Tax=Ketobacter sp. TaxID=2083498 RepID=UPI000F27B81A|nr:alpha/beta hydrolase [Ketobacter sp.]RLU01587.1 MAG: alpha/beta hydrolase [Ketobacter sp.]